MDNISGANSIVLVAILCLAFFILPILFSFLIWIKTQKLFLIAYTGNIILGLIIFWINIQILFFSVINQNSIINSMPYTKMLTMIGFVFIIVSIILQYKKCKISSNIFFNISTGIELILFIYLFLDKY